MIGGKKGKIAVKYFFVFFLCPKSLVCSAAGSLGISPCEAPNPRYVRTRLKVVAYGRFLNAVVLAHFLQNLFVPHP